MKEWAIKWVEGSIISYVRGRTSLNMVVGRIRKALNSYGLRIDEVEALIDTIENSPVYLPSLRKDEKAVRLKLVKEALTSLQSEGRTPIKKPGGEGGY